MFKKFLNFFAKHKVFSGFLIIVLIGGGYFFYNSAKASKIETRYATDVVMKSTIVTSVSGTGEISASNSVDIKAKVSAEVTSVLAVNGQAVKAGDLLVQLNTKDAQKAIRDAQINLESANLSLQKSQQGALPTDLASAQLSVDNAKANLVTVETKADFDLANVYTDTKGILQDAYNKLDDTLNRQMNGIYTGINSGSQKLSFLTANSQEENNANSKLLMAENYLTGLKQLMANFPTDDSGIETAINQCIQAITASQSFLNSLNDAVNSSIASTGASQSTLDGYKSTVSSLRSSINSSLTSVTSQKQAIASQKFNNTNNIASAESGVASALNGLAAKQVGTDPLDLRSLQLSVQQRQNTLSDASSALADYAVRAPFDGIISNVAVKKGDSASGSAVATIVTKQQVAIISLNEVDISKVQLAQKVNLTFDALPDLTLTGQVIDIDIIGTVSQGVVTYNVKIGFDSPDSSIKSGMSVSASIITEVKQDILIVPNSAIKTQGGTNYVQVFNPALPEDTTGQGLMSAVAPTAKTVVIGIADDTNTEIVSGLNEGDQVVTKTTTLTAGKPTTVAPSLLQGLTGGRGGATGGAGGVRTGGNTGGFRTGN